MHLSICVCAYGYVYIYIYIYKRQRTMPLYTYTYVYGTHMAHIAVTQELRARTSERQHLSSRRRRRSRHPRASPRRTAVPRRWGSAQHSKHSSSGKPTAHGSYIRTLSSRAQNIVPTQNHLSTLNMDLLCVGLTVADMGPLQLGAFRDHYPGSCYLRY